MASDLDTHRASIETELTNDWIATDIAWPGTSYEPGASPWLEPTILWGDGSEFDRAASRRVQLVGVLVLNLFARPGTGLGTLYGYADTLRDLFNNEDVGAVRFRTPSGPREGQGDKDKVQLTIDCPFVVEDAI